MKDNYDCIVVGGGPAGSTTAALLAMAGHSTLLVERDAMPRYHLRESLMPETYWTLRRLGVWNQVKRCRSTQPADVQFVLRDGRRPATSEQELDLRECCVTWQVERADLDRLLFDHAASHGAECRDATPVQDVIMDGDHAAGVRIARGAGPVRDVRCRILVDATGQQALLANRLGLRAANEHLRKAAVWGYYRSARREHDEDARGTVILHTAGRESWFWQIPLSEDITSIGVVGDSDYLLEGRGMPAEAFEDELVKCPALIQRLMNAELVSRFHVAREFACTTQRRAGEGWVLVGAAYGFLDPIYSPGVFFAMKSGELAADAIIDGFLKNDLSPRQLGRWTDEYDASGQLFDHVERWDDEPAPDNAAGEVAETLRLPSSDAERFSSE
ncbi:MAG: tryptophan 7-halogenase [Planctomycetes bacterium]|nr:tryptophan 7-halogenase [Planctomycetota bacterium]